MQLKIFLISLCVCILAVNTSIAESQQDYLKIILDESLKHEYDPFIVMTIVHHESRFNHLAVSKTGAIGLMQIQPTTAKYIMEKTKQEWLGKEELFKPQYNVKVGITYLKYLHKMFSDRHKVFVAYNCGPTNVRRNNIPKSSMWYADSIMKWIYTRDLMFSF